MGFLERFFKQQPPESAKKLDRNDPCWCGSDKKYEECHYEADKNFFAQTDRDGCRGSI